MARILPELYLGTAMWNWTVQHPDALTLLDRFYACGGRSVDTASNYPINRKPACFRCTEELLSNWLRANKVHDLAITVKIGSTTNEGGPENNLEPSFLLMNVDHYTRIFGSSLDCLMIHWDNREDITAISRTLDAMRSINLTGYRIGLSGVRRADLYAAAAPDLTDSWTIQIKHNLLTTAAYSHYAPFHGRAKFIAYGLNSGGLRIGRRYGETSSARVRGMDLTQDLSHFSLFLTTLHDETPGCPKTFNQLSMLFAFNSPGIVGLLIGPSNLEQLEESVAYFNNLRETDTTAIYSKVLDLMNDIRGHA